MSIPFLIKPSALLLIFTLPLSGYSGTNCYPNPPQGLLGLVDRVAQSIVTGGADFVTAKYVEMVAWAITDASSDSIQTNIRGIEAYRYLGETARTDKHLGASANANGTTSAIEKPGLISLLGFALEHGAIQQQTSDTSVTLASSPYAIIAAFEGDTPRTYSAYELLNRFSVSATFNLNDANNALTSISRKQLIEWSTRVRLTGDRSTRSERFQRFWDTEIGSVIQRRIDVTEDIITKVARDDKLSVITDTTRTDGPAAMLKSQISNYLSTHATSTQEEKTAAIKEMLLCHLRDVVFDPIHNGTVNVSGDTIAALNTSFANLAVIHAQIAIARKKLEDFLVAFRKEGTLSTLGYTRRRMDIGSDVSEVKLLFERHVKPLDIVVNAGVALYHDPDPMRNQEKVRDFTLALSLEGSSRNPVSLTEDLSRITFALTGRYERLKENESLPGRTPDIGSIQFKVEVPISLGLSIPVAYAYSTATEMSMKHDNKFNIGLKLDVDKLFALTRAKTVH